MLSLETAKKLRDAGLGWNEINLGDFLYWQASINKWDIAVIENADIIERKDETLGYIEDSEWTWLPRLDQILSEIEGRGYRYSIYVDADGMYEVKIWAAEGVGKPFYASKPEEAAAQALIWILEGAGK